MAIAFSHGYALLAGVGQTIEARWALPGAADEVQALKDILTDRSLAAYPDNAEHIRVLHDEHATRTAFRDGLVWIQDCARADPASTLLVYFSGHGWMSKTQGKYYLILHDTQSANLEETALDANEFATWIGRIRSDRVWVVMDCCHAGAVMSSDALEPVNPPQGYESQPAPVDLLDRLAKGAGRAVFSSSTGAQQSWNYAGTSIGIFTFHLLEALQGAGNKPGEREIRLSNLMNHLSRAVPNTAQSIGQRQTPYFKIEGVDFAVAATRENDYPIAQLQGGRGLPADGWPGIAEEATNTIRTSLYSIASHKAPGRVKITGDRNVVIGGNANDNTVVTSDKTVVQHGKYNLSANQIFRMILGDHPRAASNDDDKDDKVKNKRRTDT